MVSHCLLSVKDNWESGNSVVSSKESFGKTLDNQTVTIP